MDTEGDSRKDKDTDKLKSNVKSRWGQHKTVSLKNSADYFPVSSSFCQKASKLNWKHSSCSAFLIKWKLMFCHYMGREKIKIPELILSTFQYCLVSVSYRRSWSFARLLCIWWLSYFYFMNNAWHSTPTSDTLQNVTNDKFDTVAQGRGVGAAQMDLL